MEHDSSLQGAFWGLMIGLVIGVIRMVMDFSYAAPLCMEEDTRPWIVGKVYIFVKEESYVIAQIPRTGSSLSSNRDNIHSDLNLKAKSGITGCQ